MSTNSLKRIAVGLLVFSCIQISAVRAEQKVTIPEDIRKALDNLKDDNLRMNCVQASQYLYERRESISDILKDSLATLDWQGQDVVLKILMETKSFSPDETIIRLMFERLKDDERIPGITHSHDMWHYDYVVYFEDYPEIVKKVAKDYIAPRDIENLWVITRLLFKLGVLKDYDVLYNENVLNFAIASLRNDDIPNNALYATRVLFLIGDKSIPYLKREMASGDSQSIDISKFLLKIIPEKRHSKDLQSEDLSEFGETYDALWKYGIMNLDSSYITRIEKYGKNYIERVTNSDHFFDFPSLADSWLFKKQSKTTPPEFLTNGKYEKRDFGDDGYYYGH